MRSVHFQDSETDLMTSYIGTAARCRLYQVAAVRRRCQKRATCLLPDCSAIEQLLRHCILNCATIDLEEAAAIERALQARCDVLGLRNPLTQSDNVLAYQWAEAIFANDARLPWLVFNN